MAPRPQEYVATSGRKTWRVRVRHRGKATSETFHSERAAEKFCEMVDRLGVDAAIQNRARVDERSDEYMPTLAEATARHIAQLTGVHDRTRQDYEALAKRTFLPHLGNLPVDLVTRATVADLVNTLERQPTAAKAGGKARTLSRKSIAHAHGLLSAVMRTAILEEHITANPCEGVRLPRSGEHEEALERFLTRGEWLALEAALEERYRPVAQLLIGSGMRWSEATALQVRDVNLEAGTLHVVRAWKRTPGKGRELGPPKSSKSRRTILLPDQTVALVGGLLTGKRRDDFVLTAPRGGPWQYSAYRDRAWLPACEKAGLEPAPGLHSLRHTHASWLLEYGLTLEEVQDQLGHESILTTRKVYGHLQPSMRIRTRRAGTAMLEGRPALEA